MHRRVIKYEMLEDDILFERCLYNHTKESIHYDSVSTIELSKKIDENYAKLCLTRMPSNHNMYRRKVFNDCVCVYNVSYAYGNKKDVNKFIKGEGDFFNGKMNNSIKSMVFAKKAIEITINNILNSEHKIGLLITATDKRRFSAYRRLEKIGFVKSGVDFSNTFCYYYFIKN